MYNGKIPLQKQYCHRRNWSCHVCPESVVADAEDVCRFLLVSINPKAQTFFETAELTFKITLVTDKEEITISKLSSQHITLETRLFSISFIWHLWVWHNPLLNLAWWFDARKIYLHKPILTDDKVIAAFIKKISQQPKLLKTRLNSLSSLYNDFTGANSWRCTLSAKEFYPFSFIMAHKLVIITKIS